MGLPGGTKEESTTDNLGVAIGAAAGGLCFFLVRIQILKRKISLKIIRENFKKACPRLCDPAS